MKALTFHGVEDIHHETVPDPQLREPGDVIVRVEWAGLCGSDLHPYFGREVGLDTGTVVGHELVGEVVETVPGATHFHKGDRVVSPFTTSCGTCFYCRRGLTARCERGQLFGWVERGKGLHGAQAELVRVPLADSTLLAVPDGVEPELALLAGDVLATGFFTASMGGVEAGDTVAVVGCGPVGLMAVLGARELGAGRVFAFDLVKERLEMAALYGAEALDALAVDPVEVLRDATEGRGADVVLEAVGSPEATRLAVDLLRPGGTVAAAGVHTEESFAFAPGEAYDKNLTYRAGRCPARVWGEKVLPLVAEGKYDLGAMITHRLPLARGPEAKRLVAERRDGCVKVVFEP
jgi:2-desacetyl-2-hydroxyethyl bacteriochlorophyllide A dehydrogenase